MIYLGTSGYSYEDWRGAYYPSNLNESNWLSYYAAEFQTVELNFTYYRLATADQIERLAEQTPLDFRFSVKAHRDMTHTRTGDPVIFAQFRAAMWPLQRDEKLGAILLQFPYAFRYAPENIYYLEHCVKQLPEMPLVFEFRHNSWIAQRVLNQLREWQVAFCNVDMPKLPGLLPQTTFVTAPTAYVRFHGRNASQWWHHEHAWERYNYQYTEQEIAEWVPHLVKMGQEAENMYVYANNHWQGQSVTTVRQIKMHMEQGADKSESG